MDLQARTPKRCLRPDIRRVIGVWLEVGTAADESCVFGLEVRVYVAVLWCNFVGIEREMAALRIGGGCLWLGTSKMRCFMFDASCRRDLYL